MSMEVSGGLIQMTAHMVVSKQAHAMIVGGAIAAALFAFLAICAALSRQGGHKWRYALAFLAIAVAGAIMVASGAKRPREKIIYCCASGPVNLETVATVYDIIGVDGKLLTLRAR